MCINAARCGLILIAVLWWFKTTDFIGTDHMRQGNVEKKVGDEKSLSILLCD